MIVRFGAAVLLVGLSFASPSSAETLLHESGLSLDLREGETLALDSLTDASVEISVAVDATLAQLPAVEIPGPLAELSGPDLQASTPEPLQISENIDPVPVEDHQVSTTAFLGDRDGNEDFAWMTAELTFASEMTTGSLGNATSSPSEPSDAALTSLPSPLTDDALPIE